MEGKFIAFETKAFYKLIEEVTSRVTNQMKPKKEPEQKEWVTSKEAKELLGIKSNGKLKQLVSNKYICASQHGRTIVYSRKSILEFLEESKIS
ncbi:helix-turn-helix domain-containing protein [Aquimarina sp. 2201CG1-2-11]|uniref:helix-turn-helix domain-containing protein n=1 Tax=Aquimarina discodermiae TaxID=3231043 RepID=UPI003462840A